MEGNGFPGGYQYPPGFRFHPSDQELILQYLSKKVTGTLSPANSIIAEIDLYKFSPWDLPAKAFFGEGEWFFFSPRDRKYPNGARPNRAAGSGYWKATGTDKPILATGGSHCLGVKKALVYYKGRPPKGIKTDWVMHEYRLLDSNPCLSHKHKSTMRLDDWVLCRVRQKGNLPHQGEEKQESSNIYLPFTIQQAEMPEMRPRDSTFQWGDYQLLAYLMSAGDEKQSSGQNSDSGSAKSSIDGGGTQPHLVSSFGALDEIMVLPPSKRLNCSRLNCSNSPAEDFSPSASFSVDQVDHC